MDFKWVDVNEPKPELTYIAGVDLTYEPDPIQMMRGERGKGFWKLNISGNS